MVLLWVFVFRRRPSKTISRGGKEKNGLDQDSSLVDREETRARIGSDRILPNYNTKPCEEGSSNEEAEDEENQQRQQSGRPASRRALLAGISKEPAPPTSALEPFNSAKTHFLEYLKKSYYVAPDELFSQ